MSDQTFAEKARNCWPGVSDEALEDLLWSSTCFPFGTETQVMAQLRLSYTTSGGDIQKAIDDAHAEIEAAMNEYREMYPVDGDLMVDMSNG